MILEDIIPSTAPEENVVSVPRVSKWLVRLFGRYVFRYMRRSFHAVRISRGANARPSPDLPTIIYINHPSWWDPLFCIVIALKLFPDRNHFAPMDAAALKRYKFFGRLGFFGVKPDSMSGARAFLRTGQAILSQSNAMLWVTPQGRFADPRVRPVSFRPGLGHLVHRTPRCALMPIAIEYPFWEERFPEALARCGEVVFKDRESAETPEQWTGLLERKLENAQKTLADDCMQRNREIFETLLQGRAGVGGIYDFWRSIGARLRGRAFRAEHGESSP